MRYLPRYLNPGLQMDAQCERPRRGQNCMWREVGQKGRRDVDSGLLEKINQLGSV